MALRWRCGVRVLFGVEIAVQCAVQSAGGYTRVASVVEGGAGAGVSDLSADFWYSLLIMRFFICLILQQYGIHDRHPVHRQQ